MEKENNNFYVTICLNHWTGGGWSHSENLDSFLINMIPSIDFLAVKNWDNIITEDQFDIDDFDEEGEYTGECDTQVEITVFKTYGEDDEEGDTPIEYGYINSQKPIISATHWASDLWKAVYGNY